MKKNYIYLFCSEGAVYEGILQGMAQDGTCVWESLPFGNAALCPRFTKEPVWLNEIMEYNSSTTGEDYRIQLDKVLT